MSATLIFGVDFKRTNPRAQRAFWTNREAVEIEHVERIEDSAPCEYVAPTEDSA